MIVNKLQYTQKGPAPNNPHSKYESCESEFTGIIMSPGSGLAKLDMRR